MQSFLEKLFNRYMGDIESYDSTNSVIGILLVNLGTPTEATVKGVRKFLSEFLSDPRVVEIPPLLWQPILQGIILRRRPAVAVKAYQKIWTQAGSPLLVISRKIASGLAQLLQTKTDKKVYVELAMRYGTPSIRAGLMALHKAKASKIVILPLYPQYAAATTASTFDAIAKTLSRWRWLPELTMINQYATHPSYIAAVAQSIERFWQQQPRGQLLLFSFHGLPKASVDAGDPYYQQCQLTAQLIAEKLQLDPNSWRVVFQSRFGLKDWLQPYCDKTLQALPQQGIKTVDIVCPGFPADCLETLEEISIRNHELFIAVGGEQLHYIPALNDSLEHLQVLAEIVEKRLLS